MILLYLFSRVLQECGKHVLEPLYTSNSIIKFAKKFVFLLGVEMSETHMSELHIYK